MRSCIQEENLYTPNCIRTFTGIYINVFEPALEMIRIEDIAHALSNQCRFGGHLPKFYSVAQHSIMCSKFVDNESKLQALLHDASEAYLLDIPKPIKLKLPNYKVCEDGLMKLIAEKFGFNPEFSQSTKEVDEYLLQWEWSTLMLGRKIFPEIKCLWPGEAEELFLTTFDELKGVTA